MPSGGDATWVVLELDALVTGWANFTAETRSTQRRPGKLEEVIPNGLPSCLCCGNCHGTSARAIEREELAW